MIMIVTTSWLYSLSMMMLQINGWYEHYGIITAIATVAINSSFVILARSFEGEWHCIDRSCNDFAIRSAHCFCEDDRQLVQSSIVGIMRELHYVDNLASDEEILDAFDALVAEKLPIAIHARLCVLGIPYHYLASAFLFLVIVRRG